jgi:hypothetical protein
MAAASAAAKAAMASFNGGVAKAKKRWQ